MGTIQMPGLRSFAPCLPAVLLVSSFAHADWPKWRGPDDSGSIAVGTFPQQLTASETAWTADLPGKGCSTPIVWQNQILVTAPIDGQDAILAFDQSGKPRWQTSFDQETAGKHRNGSGCNASPITDGSGVFVYFKSGMLAAVNLDGTNRWQTDLVKRFGPDNRYWDHGTSPVLTKNHVIMARMHEGDSWLAAFDKKTGELAWKVARNYTVPKESDQCYTTPIVMQHNGREVVLVWGAEHLTMHDAADGSVVWSCGGFNPEQNKLWPAIANPVIIGEMAVICFGRNDRGIPRMFGVRLTGSGDVTETNHVWVRNDISSFVPSPVAYKGKVYLVRDKGQIECIDPATGKTVWSDRFPKHRTSYYASPLIASDLLYAPREDGTVFVASVANDQFQLLSENEFEQPVIGSPVPDGNRILIRGEKKLFCLTDEK
ncbi:outer membrane biogenesis protein BamB [Stieleria bergensis]|uniref:Outer membrane biogenesis protein BamB n=1 Tax=Stieleria bergensis TaxID=2528025 RepID=A0A517ST62_9BACT|nr:outer membrane biogenesis protein BamB [Planctomycetes bacterium SV_7m_r]